MSPDFAVEMVPVSRLI